MPSPETTYAYLLPDLGEGMTEAEIVRWLVAPGEHVLRDQIVAHVQTDKAEVELPVPLAGTVLALGGSAGDVLPVGAPLLELAPDDAAALPGTGIRGTGATAAPATPAPPAPPAPPGGGASAPLAAPPTRRLARELGVDLATVAGSGPGGRVTTADVRAAAARTGPEPAAGAGTHPEPLRGIRRVMARTMADAWRAVPHISLFDEIDARPLLAAHASARARIDELTLTAWFARAAVRALVEFPRLNASLDEGADVLVYHDACHVGVAVATDAGLVVPVVHDAQDLDLAALAGEITRLTTAARAGGLPLADVRGATFTVTNFGTHGGRFATPIVRPPEVAILGTGAIARRPVVDGDAVVAAPALPVSLSADHRVVDGADATQFLERVLALLSDPQSLIGREGRGDGRNTPG